MSAEKDKAPSKEISTADASPNSQGLVSTKVTKVAKKTCFSDLSTEVVIMIYNQLDVPSQISFGLTHPSLWAIHRSTNPKIPFDLDFKWDNSHLIDYLITFMGSDYLFCDSLRGFVDVYNIPHVQGCAGYGMGCECDVCAWDQICYWALEWSEGNLWNEWSAEKMKRLEEGWEMGRMGMWDWWVEWKTGRGLACVEAGLGLSSEY